MKDNELLTVGKAAKLIGCCKQTVRRLCDSGVLESHSIPSGHRRIPLGSVRSYIAKTTFTAKRDVSVYTEEEVCSIFRLLPSELESLSESESFPSPIINIGEVKRWGRQSIDNLLKGRPLDGTTDKSVELQQECQRHRDVQA